MSVKRPDISIYPSCLLPFRLFHRAGAIRTRQASRPPSSHLEGEAKFEASETEGETERTEREREREKVLSKKGYIDRVGPGPSAGTPPHDFRGGSTLSLSLSRSVFLSFSISPCPIYYRHRMHIVFPTRHRLALAFPTSAATSTTSTTSSRIRAQVSLGNSFCVDVDVPLPRGTRSAVSRRRSRFSPRTYLWPDIPASFGSSLMRAIGGLVSVVDGAAFVRFLFEACVSSVPLPCLDGNSILVYSTDITFCASRRSMVDDWRCSKTDPVPSLSPQRIKEPLFRRYQPFAGNRFCDNAIGSDVSLEERRVSYRIHRGDHAIVALDKSSFLGEKSECSSYFHGFRYWQFTSRKSGC